MEAAGIEPAHEFPNVLSDKGLQKPPTSHTAHWQDPAGRNCRCITSPGEDASFDHIAAAWPFLPPHIRETILTLVDAGQLKTPAKENRHDFS